MRDTMDIPTLPRRLTAASLDQLEAEVSSAREAIFSLADAARESAPHRLIQIHDSLQIVANELGHVERALFEARDGEVAAA